MRKIKFLYLLFFVFTAVYVSAEAKIIDSASLLNDSEVNEPEKNKSRNINSNNEKHFSFGVTFGSEIAQSYSIYKVSDGVYNPYPVIKAIPDFGLVLDFAFDKFGLSSVFELNYTYTKIEDNEKNPASCTTRSEHNELIYLEPYIPLKINNFVFSVGPVIGVKFYQYEYNYSYSTSSETTSSKVYFMLGASCDLRYHINEHLSFYMAFPFVINAGESEALTITDGKVESSKYTTFGSDSIKALPKIGLLFRI